MRSAGSVVQATSNIAQGNTIVNSYIRNVEPASAIVNSGNLAGAALTINDTVRGTVD